MWTAVSMVAIILVGNLLALLIARRRVRLENDQRQKHYRIETLKGMSGHKSSGPPNRARLG